MTRRRFSVRRDGWTDENTAALRVLYPKHSVEVIAERLDTTTWSVSGKINAMHLSGTVLNEALEQARQQIRAEIAAAKAEWDTAPMFKPASL